MIPTATLKPPLTVRPGTRQDLPVLAPMLARSFQTCPAWEWYLPPESQGRLQRMERFFEFLLDRFYLGGPGECLAADDRTGAALWDRPDEWKMGTGDNLRMLRTMTGVFGRRFSRAVRGFGRLDSGHPRAPHYYLSVLGVWPEANGSGVARTLMRPGLQRCDRERMPAYLETGRPQSRDFFAGNGFEVIEELKLPGGGPPVWRMWREPTA
jgi:GNAT superfamily N-acetyltransferase